MNRLLATLVILIAFGLLVNQSLGWGSSNARAQGLIVALVGEAERIQGEHVLEALNGEELRRGEVVKTGEGWVLIEYGDARIALAQRTEIQLTAPDVVKLIGGRVLTFGPATITTPWIDVRSSDLVSVVNYAWKGEVDIIPIKGASTVVDNETLGTLPVSFPSTWISAEGGSASGGESERDLVTSLEPFNVETSSEAEFYTWALDLLKEATPSDDEIE